MCPAARLASISNLPATLQRTATIPTTRARAAGPGGVADLLHRDGALPRTLRAAALPLLATRLVLQRRVLAAVRLPDPGEYTLDACLHSMFLPMSTAVSLG